jgi:diadenosine tetraphosphate (Ap4A) HIT family hydrolase
VSEETSCVFCRIVRGEFTPGVLAYRDEHVAVFPALRQQPKNRGHMLVVPVKHVAQVYDVDDALAGPLMTTLARVARAVKTVRNADGVTIRQNNERHGGQDVFHVHFHVIPRFEGDRFDLGEYRFPFGAKEVPLEERIEMANSLREEIRNPKHEIRNKFKLPKRENLNRMD